VGTALFEKLGSDLARAALDTTPRPWDIRVPTAASWQAIHRHLTQALRAREPSGQDTLVSYVRIDSVTVRGDTVHARFTLGVYWRCRIGRGGGTSTGYEVYAIRRMGYWQPPRTSEFEWGDSTPCRQ
jgi:hypothetical protein